MPDQSPELTDAIAQRLHVVSRAGIPALSLALLAWFVWLHAETTKSVADALDRQTELFKKSVELSIEQRSLERQALESRRELMRLMERVTIRPADER